jgi:hypothetical protein
LSFEKENNFTLLASENQNVIEPQKKNQNKDHKDHEIIEKDSKDEYINLLELKALDENLDLIKKKMAALEMWKTVNESTGKLCLGDLVKDSNFSLDDSKIYIKFIFFILNINFLKNQQKKILNFSMR